MCLEIQTDSVYQVPVQILNREQSLRIVLLPIAVCADAITVVRHMFLMGTRV